jgi:hypothetical protein
MSLSFTVDPGSRQRCHSRVRVPRNSRPYFTVSDSRLPQPGGTGPRIYIPQEQDVPVTLPGPVQVFERASTDRIEYTASSSFSVVACVSVAAIT